MPLKNQGRGGYFSCDFSFGFNRDKWFCKKFLGVKFWDTDFNLLFSFSREDLLTVEDIPWNDIIDEDYEYESPYFDICKLRSNDFLILFCFHNLNTINETTSKKYILRYENGRLTYVTDAVDQMLALGRISKKKYSSAINTFADGIAKNLDTIIF